MRYAMRYFCPFRIYIAALLHAIFPYRIAPPPLEGGSVWCVILKRERRERIKKFKAVQELIHEEIEFPERSRRAI
jgi:hypothetical protein